MTGSFVSFDRLAFWDEYFIITLSFVLFLGLLEMLRFFQFISHLSNFLATIKYASSQLLAYSVVFGIAFWAYSLLGKHVEKRFRYHYKLTYFE